MTDTFEFTLDNPLTEEQWDMIADVDMERTERVTFRTKHGKEVEFVKARHAKWIPKITKIGGIDWPSGMKCSGCGEDALNAEGADFLTDFCPHCGARMVEDE